MATAPNPEYARDCACRNVSRGMKHGLRRMVVLTAPEDSEIVRKGLAAVMPEDSRCTGASWTAPDGTVASVYRYDEPLPKLDTPFALFVCNGGRVLTQEDSKNVQRWRDTGPDPLPFVDHAR